MFFIKSLIALTLFTLLFSGCWGWGHGHIKKPRLKHIKIKKVHYISPVTTANFA